MSQDAMNAQAEMPLADLSFLTDFEQNDELKAAISALAREMRQNPEEALERPVADWLGWLEDEGYEITDIGDFFSHSEFLKPWQGPMTLKALYTASSQQQESTKTLLEQLKAQEPEYFQTVSQAFITWLAQSDALQATAGGTGGLIQVRYHATHATHATAKFLSNHPVIRFVIGTGVEYRILKAIFGEKKGATNPEAGTNPATDAKAAASEANSDAQSKSKDLTANPESEQLERKARTAVASEKPANPTPEQQMDQKIENLDPGRARRDAMRTVKTDGSLDRKATTDLLESRSELTTARGDGDLMRQMEEFGTQAVTDGENRLAGELSSAMNDEIGQITHEAGFAVKTKSQDDAINLEDKAEKTTVIATENAKKAAVNYSDNIAEDLD